MKLLIVESPAKARKIKTFLGEDYTVEATMGHIREIPERELGVNIENGFTPTFVVREDKREVVEKLKRLAETADEVLIASDPDREGEAISKHVFDILPVHSQVKCKRVVYHEITKKAILAAISKPREIDQNLVAAAYARQVLDRLIGYRVSPVLWSSVGKGTSAGRVQSVALKLVCEKQREIDAFTAVVFWYIDVLLKSNGGDFWARVVVPTDKNNRFTDKTLSTAALKKLKESKYCLSDVQKASRSVSPKPPFDTNSMQSAASAVMKWDITKTMKVAQDLYTSGKISYIRSDSFNISEEAMTEVRQHITAEFGQAYLSKKPNTYAKKSTSGAQEAHECIRPTHMSDAGGDLAGDDAKLYKLVRDRFLACQMAPMVIDTVKFVVDADCGEKLVAAGQTLAFDGFSKVWYHKSQKEDDDGNGDNLPPATKGESLEFQEAKQTENKTKPPARYTDASLASKMEADGVGRPATRAPIIKSMEDKGYLTKDKTALVPTPVGLSIVDFLAPSFGESFMDIKFTAGMEEEMAKIADGKATFLGVVSAFWTALKTNIEKFGVVSKDPVNTGVKCPVCHEGDIIERTGKSGKFLSCNKYPACKTVVEKLADGSFGLKAKKSFEETGEPCSVCEKGNIVLRHGSYGDFYACNNYPACTATFSFVGDKFVSKKKPQPK